MKTEVRLGTLPCSCGAGTPEVHGPDDDGDYEVECVSGVCQRSDSGYCFSRNGAVKEWNRNVKASMEAPPNNCECSDKGEVPDVTRDQALLDAVYTIINHHHPEFDVVERDLKAIDRSLNRDNKVWWSSHVNMQKALVVGLGALSLLNFVVLLGHLLGHLV